MLGVMPVFIKVSCLLSNSVTATTGVSTQISKNIGSWLQYLQCMEVLHARSNSSFSCQIH